MIDPTTLAHIRTALINACGREREIAMVTQFGTLICGVLHPTDTRSAVIAEARWLPFTLRLGGERVVLWEAEAEHDLLFSISNILYLANDIHEGNREDPHR